MARNANLVASTSLFIVFTTTVLSACGGAVNSGFRDNPPLPDHITIVKPRTDVPPKIAAYSGIWSGVWKREIAGRLLASKEHILVVELVSETEAYVVWSVASDPAGAWAGKAGWYRYRGRFIDDVLVINKTNSEGLALIITYKMNPQGWITAEEHVASCVQHRTEAKVGCLKADMAKLEDADVARLVATPIQIQHVD